MVLVMLLTLMMQVGMLGSSSPGEETPEFIQGSYVYLNWSYEDELAYEREKAKHKEIVYEAAIEAVTHNYYAPTYQVNQIALDKLNAMARDLEVNLTKQDKILLKMEIEQIRRLQIIDEEELITLL